MAAILKKWRLNKFETLLMKQNMFIWQTYAITVMANARKEQLVTIFDMNVSVPGDIKMRWVAYL